MVAYETYLFRTKYFVRNKERMWQKIPTLEYGERRDKSVWFQVENRLIYAKCQHKET